MPCDIVPFDRSWPLPDAFHMACLLEVTAAKVGNVHPSAAFSDMHAGHFIVSSTLLRGVFEKAIVEGRPLPGVGRLVLDGVKATRGQVGCNTNLGTILLLAPIARAHSIAHSSTVESVNAPSTASLRNAVGKVLATLTSEDCELVYEAIRVARPGGLGEREVDDVSGTGPKDLLAAMQHLAGVDAVARQYTNACGDLFGFLLPWFAEELHHTQNAERISAPLEAICRLQLRWLAHEPDGLIVRKNGEGLAQDIQQRAAAAWNQVRGQDGPVMGADCVRELDQFLRGDGHRRNPGTTADLIAATLAIALLVDFSRSDGYPNY